MRTEVGDIICYTRGDYTIYQQLRRAIKMVESTFERNQRSIGRVYQFRNSTEAGVKKYNSTWEKLV